MIEFNRTADTVVLSPLGVKHVEKSLSLAT
jgi:hypothetical protein